MMCSTSCCLNNILMDPWNVFICMCMKVCMYVWMASVVICWFSLSVKYVNHSFSSLSTFYWFFIFLPGNWKTACDSLYPEWCKYFWLLSECWTIMVEVVCGEQSLFLYDDVFHVQYSGRTSGFNRCIWNIFQWWVDCCWIEIQVSWDVIQFQLVNT